MRTKEPENSRIYVRFHIELDGKINIFCKKTGMKRATAVAWILNRFIDGLTEKNSDFSDITLSDLAFSPKGAAYHVPIGRSDAGRITGRRTLITLSRAADRNLNYIAAKAGLTTSELRAEILVAYFDKNGMI